ncbi:MAG: hypothetical protein N3E42_00940 [Candidatus Bipolaricaulota bacterium]|nr:hypothetical protein [Candidatus Bipolaricaulota bacterium]
MFRRLLAILATLAVVAAGWSLPAAAAPVSGSVTLDIVFLPANVYDCLAGAGIEPCKIDKIFVKFEADLVLTLSISGVDITSTSIFTFKGLEFQMFTVIGTVGALTFKSQIIFAPNIVEVEVVKDAFGRTRYCINDLDPVPTSNYFPGSDNDLSEWLCAFPVNYTGSTFWNLLQDIIHPVEGNLRLATVFDTADHLDPALTFRKKIAEMSLSLAGLTIGLRGLFANLGSAALPDWNMGVVASVEGQTVSGIVIRGETWIGARQGLECFGECKPLERIRGGKVEPDFIIYEEKLFIRNLKVAGVTFGARLEFNFADTPFPPTNHNDVVGLRFVALTQDFTLAPFGLTINNVINIQDPDGPAGLLGLSIVQDVLTTSLKVGDISVLAQFVIRPATTGAFNIYFAQLISTFDAPGVKVTDILVPCLDENVCNFPAQDGMLDHQLILSTTVGDVSININLYFFGLFRGFYRAVIEVSWKLGNVTIKSTSIIPVDPMTVYAGWVYLPAQKIGIELTF